MVEIMCYMWLAGVAGLALGWITSQIVDERKNRRAEYWLRGKR